MLKIKYKSNSDTVEFGSLKPGQLFEYNGRLLIKMHEDAEDAAFDFTYLDTTILANCSEVIPREATLTVEN